MALAWRRRMKPVERVLGQLDKVRRVSDGWTARCPSHNDKRPSLHVGGGDDGRVLLKCFATCTFDDVIGALGLDAADLFDDNRKRRIAGKWRKDYADMLEGAKVAVLPDADTPGLDHAETIAKSLTGA